jgi:SNF2 family DNA or RNA helicase
MSNTTLHSYQDRAVTRFYEYPESIAVMPMGSGKTVSVLTAFQELRDANIIKRMLVVAPLRVAKLVWPYEAIKWPWLRHLRIVPVIGNADQRRKALEIDADIHVVTYDLLPWFMEHKPKWYHPDVVCFDEITRLKNPKSVRAKAVYKWLQGIPSVWGLSGTIAPNGLHDLFMPAKLVTRGKLWGKSFYAWRQQHYEKHPFKDYEWTLKDGHDKIIEQEFATIAFTVSEEDMPELPELVFDPIWVELPALSVASYKQMQREYIMAHGDKPIIAANAGAMTMKLRQISQGFIYTQDGEALPVHNEKIDALAELIKNMNGKPLLIAYDFKEDLKRISELATKMFGSLYKLPHIGAGVDYAQSELLVKRWNGKQLPLLAVHPASAGHGLNMQDGGCHIAWYGLVWSLELFLQLIARLRRQGQRSAKVWNHVIMARNVTIDQEQLAALQGKQTLEDAAINALTTI